MIAACTQECPLPYLPITCPLLAHDLTYPLPAHDLPITYPLPTHYLQLLIHHLPITCPLPAHYLPITDPLPAHYLQQTVYLIPVPPCSRVAIFVAEPLLALGCQPDSPRPWQGERRGHSRTPWSHSPSGAWQTAGCWCWRRGSRSLLCNRS